MSTEAFNTTQTCQINISFRYIIGIYYASMYREKAFTLLSKLESELRDLTAQAANAGEYEDVIALTSWAKMVGQLLGTSSTSLTKLSAPLTEVQTPQSGRVRRKTPPVYPRFLRRRNDLIKIGWSKRERKEYEHKAPHSVVEALIGSLRKVGSGRKLFTMEDILPLTLSDGSEAPDYQTYLALAWLRANSLVQQQGRRGYTTPNISTIEQQTQSCWRSLNEN